MDIPFINLSFSEASSLFTSPFAQPTTARKVAAVAIFIFLTVVTFGIYAIGFFILNKWRDRVTSPEASTIYFIPPPHLSPLAGAGASPSIRTVDAVPTDERNRRRLSQCLFRLNCLMGEAIPGGVALPRLVQIGNRALAEVGTIQTIITGRTALLPIIEMQAVIDWLRIIAEQIEQSLSTSRIALDSPLAANARAIASRLRRHENLRCQ